MRKDTSPKALEDSDAIVECDPRSQSFNYQLEFLKLEYGAINEIIKRIDEMTQKNKDWAVLIWAGSISLIISQENLRRYILLTAVLPLLFWFLDAWWRRIQRTCIFRIQKISEFLNGDNLVESFQQKKLVNFHVLDPRGQQYRNTPEYKDFIGILRTMRFKEVGVFYLGLVFISTALGLFFILIS